MFSCKEKAPKEVVESNVLTENIKLDFLHEILSDSTGNGILKSRNRYISNYFDISPLHLSIDIKNDSLDFFESEYIAEKLEIQNINFIKQQMDANSSFDYDKLKKYGFNVLDVEGFIKKGIVGDAILEYTKKQGNYGMLMFSVPVFNKELNKAYIRMYDFGGETLIYEKVNGKWRIKDKIDKYVF